MCTIFREFALEAKRDRVGQDNRERCPGRLQSLDRERWTSATKGSDTGNRHHSRMWVTSGAQKRRSADENMIMNGLTMDHRESTQHLARRLQEREWSVQKRRYGDPRKIRVSTETYTRKKSTCTSSEEVDDESCIDEIDRN